MNQYNCSLLRWLKFFTLFALTSIGFLQLASAYFVASPADQGPMNYKKSVRILVSGRGTDLGLQPQLTALGRYQLYKRNFPEDQVVLISVFENERNEPLLIKNGWVFNVNNSKNLETDVVTKEILKFQKIRSLEFFGHNSPSLGTQSDGLGFRYDFRKPIVATLASHFTKNAYAIIHGCNSGWITAPALAKTWGIAVAGSFTGTRFERLHSDGHFYVADEEKAPNDNWARSNPDLDNVRCSEGGCLRMRPQYSRYQGKWGDFGGPFLMHYKFFCQNDINECEKTMAASLFGFVSDTSLRRDSTYAEFREVAKQYLCPVYLDRKITEECHAELDRLETGHGNRGLFFGVKHPQLKCDLRSCTGKMTCEDHTCNIANRESKNASTMAQEYLHLLNGFRMIEQQGF